MSLKDKQTILTSLKGAFLQGKVFVLFDFILFVPSTIFQLNRDVSS